MKLIEQVEQFRKLRKVNKQTLCRNIGINKNTYSNYLSGKTSPSAEVLEKLTKELNCKIIIIDSRI